MRTALRQCGENKMASLQHDRFEAVVFIVISTHGNPLAGERGEEKIQTRSSNALLKNGPSSANYNAPSPESTCNPNMWVASAKGSGGYWGIAHRTTKLFGVISSLYQLACKVMKQLQSLAAWPLRVVKRSLTNGLLQSPHLAQEPSNARFEVF